MLFNYSDCDKLDMPESLCINMITYACPHGDAIVTGDRVRKCGKDGVWNGTYPECASGNSGDIVSGTEISPTITGKGCNPIGISLSFFTCCN